MTGLLIRGALFLLTLTAATPPARRASLQVAVEDAADPWSRRDGTGYANDVVRAAFRAVDIDVTFLVVPYARCKDMVVHAKVVACFSMSRAPDVEAAVAFPAMPLFVCEAALLQSAAHPLPAATLDALPRGTVIGAVLGYEYPEAVERARASGAITLENSPSEELLLRKLAAGRLRGALVNVNESKPLAYLSAQARVADGIQRVGTVGRLDSYIGFSRRHPRGTWGLQQFEEGMRRITRSGALASIAHVWADSASARALALRARPVGRSR